MKMAISHYRRQRILPQRRKENGNDYCHNLAPVVEGRFKVTKADDRTVVIKRPDFSVQGVSRARLVMA